MAPRAPVVTPPAAVGARDVADHPVRRVPTPVALLFLVALAAAARAVHAATGWLTLPATTLVLGVGVGEAFARRPRLRRFEPPAELPLALGMILLGAQFDATTFARIGVGGVALLLVHWAAIGGLFALAARTRLLAARDAGVLAVGLSGCGLSAVLAAVRGDPQAPHHARTVAVATTLAAGALGFAAWPSVAAAVGLDGLALARVASTTLPTTAEAVLVAAPHGEEALRVAGSWRFVVNALQWVPIVAYLAVFGPRDRATGRGPRSVLRRVPTFTWGLAAFGALGVAGAFGPGERLALSRLVSWAFLVALAGVGVRTRVGPVVRAWRPALVALVAWSLAAGLARGVVAATEPAPTVVPPAPDLPAPPEDAR